MKNSITLINTPKKDYKEKDNSNEIHINKTYPIGLLSISSYLKENLNNTWEIKYIDANFKHLSIDNIVNRIQSKYVGLNATFPNAHIVKKICQKLKRENSYVKKIIIGGPASTLSPDYFLKDNFIDFAVLGEGEETTTELLNALENKQPTENIKGIAYKRDNKIIKTKERKPLDINKIPFTDIDNIPEEIKQLANEITLITSRGCKYNCPYCSTPTIWGKGNNNLRTQTAKRIIAEIDNYVNKGFKFETIHFVDDNFISNWKRVIEFIALFNKKYHKTKNWRCVARINDIYQEEKIKYLAENNCTEISIGVETASEKILKTIGRPVNMEKVTNFSYYCRKYGIKSKAFFMLGFPDETEEDILKTINYIKEKHFDEVGVNILSAYPNTPLFKQIYGNDYSNQIPLYLETTNPNNKLEKYSDTPEISLSKHLTIKDLIKYKSLIYKNYDNEK
jgi:magnesium-protoporphyrin IX monomethyl ester (oxidative) cyclase